MRPRERIQANPWRYCKKTFAGKTGKTRNGGAYDQRWQMPIYFSVTAFKNILLFFNCLTQMLFYLSVKFSFVACYTQQKQKKNWKNSVRIESHRSEAFRSNHNSNIYCICNSPILHRSLCKMCRIVQIQEVSLPKVCTASSECVLTGTRRYF